MSYLITAEGGKRLTLIELEKLLMLFSLFFAGKLQNDNFGPLEYNMPKLSNGSSS